MPKPKLPPQGGEKWFCISTFLFMMFSVIMTVTIIYCIVIIYAPSVREQQTTFLGPKRCTTTYMNRNQTGTPEDGLCEWASCMEWCLNKGNSPCSQMHGKLREIGATVSFEGCALEEPEGRTEKEKEERPIFVDHTCRTLDDIKPINCKRSQHEPSDKISPDDAENAWKLPGERERCFRFDDLISCEAGYCKNVSEIYDCSFTDSLEELLKPHGSQGQLDGYCNCNRCTQSNTTLVSAGELTCPKSTEYCFLPEFEKLKNKDTIDPDKLKELCAPENRNCQTCYDICVAQKNCLNIKSRVDVISFGVNDDSDPKPQLAYYNCRQGNCTQVSELKCRRTCDEKQFHIEDFSVILLQAERVVMASCQKSLINETVEINPVIRKNEWNKLIASCSNITIDKELKSIKATDCVNGTWIENLGKINYTVLTRTYEEYRSDTDRWVKRSPSENENLIFWEDDITIYNYTKLLKNQEGCVNTLSMECMEFFSKYGRDGYNYTARAVFDCYYTEEDSSYVVIDYFPERTFFLLILWSAIPAAVFTISCLYMCICSKFAFTGDDGHMRIYCCGKAVTGIGNVVVYKPPSKNMS